MELLTLNKFPAIQNTPNISDTMKPKIMITGAIGFTGKHACDYFKQKGYHVVAVTRNIKGLLSDDLLTYEHCELTDKNSVYNLIHRTKPEYLLHLAGQNHVPHSWKNPISSFEANVMSTAYLIDAIRISTPTCKVIIVGSALQFDPNELSTLLHPYSLSKTIQSLIAQSWERLYGMNLIIAKPTNLIGPGESNGVCSILAKKVVEMEFNNAEKILELNNQYIKRDFLDVRDAVVAYETLFNKGISGMVYDISTGNSVFLKEITDTLLRFSNIEFTVKSIDNKQENSGEIVPSLLHTMGWQPLIPFEQSIQAILTYFREQKFRNSDTSF